MAESLVDLLLVRLGREEEKRKVLKLLVTNLDLSMTDAENAVNNSPSVIREAVPMGEARAIQKDLYPYIDLLPRFDDEDSEEPDEISEDPVEEDEEEADYEEDFQEVEAEDVEPPSHAEADDDAEEPDAGEDWAASIQEDVLITSASDEVRSTNRCHICGRTPTDGEKLAPCRTCGDLTCRECFDRLAHVCSKCAASGKAIERPNEGVTSDRQEGLVFDSDEEKSNDEGSGGTSIVRYVVAGLLFLVALAAVFYFMDPMDIFGEDTDEGVLIAGPVDSTGTVDSDSLETLQADSAVTEPDSALTVITEPETPDSLGLSRLVLGDEYAGIDPPSGIPYRTTAPNSIRAEVLAEEMETIAGQLAIITAAVPVVLDEAILLQYHDTTCVLVLGLKHPVDTERRLDLLRRVSYWLMPSEIDQLVLLYKENRYQNTVIMSLVAANFPMVQGVISPVEFQDYLSYREDCWESLSGSVSEWLTSIQ